IYTDPSGKRVYSCDLGLDKVLIYRLDAEKGTLTPNDPPFAAVAPGSGPRHLAFHPKGGFAYVINEMLNTVSAFKHDAANGKLEEIQTVPTLPEGFTDKNSTAEIFVHPNGRFVYGSNRGHDSIVVFAAGADGKLTLVQHEPTGGKAPRNFGLDPGGKWLLAANQQSNDIFVFKVDPATGKLTATGEKVTLAAPMCVMFVP
ncbi:MAG: lactonase family protein, partial [Verrucomicrobiota bacterium]|nr:lactonase family protein [Verrucomicrobiota bacterium]